MNRSARGRDGEAAAAAHLERLGYAIAERNVRLRSGEIDIVAVRGEEVVLVEVRGKTGSRFGSGLESVDLRKRRRLSAAAREYVQRRRLADARLRFDVVGVSWRDGEAVIDHVENAFEAEPE